MTIHTAALAGKVVHGACKKARVASTGGTVKSAITYTLIDNIENLTLVGAKSINGTGNEFNNNLICNATSN
jgi:hypothetical protein